MKEPLLKIKFVNSTNPTSTFDLLKLEELFQREAMDHSPESPHRVEFYILLFITGGQGQHTIDFTDYTYEQGSVLTIRKDQIHKFFRKASPKGYLLLFTDEFLVSYLEKLEAQKSLQLFNELLGSPKLQLSPSDYDTIHGIIGRIKEEYDGQLDDYSLGIIRSELHVLITKLFRIKSRSHQMPLGKRYLSDFIAFQTLVEDQVTTTLRVADYADQMAISTKTLNTITKSIVNKTAKEFIDEIGVKQMKRLLINTPHSIKEIAYSSGFEETTNFYKYFKRHVGMTPEQFRASH